MIHHLAKFRTISRSFERIAFNACCLPDESAAKAVHADRRTDHLINAILGTQAPSEKNDLRPCAPLRACKMRMPQPQHCWISEPVPACAREAADGTIFLKREGLTATHFSEEALKRAASVSADQITAPTNF